MGANHGGGLGGLSPSGNFTGGAGNKPSPQKNQVLAPPLFVI